MNTPKVSIIILNWNQLAYLKNCLQSLTENTSYPHYEVIVWDNGSTEKGTKEFLSTLPHKVFVSPDNLGFAKGNNEAAKQATGDLLLFLNNDILTHKNWLSPMVQLLLQHPDCGIVGSKLLYPDGKIQHIGVMFDWRGNSCHIFKKYPSTIKPAKISGEREAVTGASLLIRRNIFEKVKGFDEKYIHGSEDIDLCFAVREMGWKVMFCADSVLTHYEQVSLMVKGGRYKKKTTRHNIKLFQKKWRQKIDCFRLSNDFARLRPYDYYRNERRDIERLIPKGARFILDVGCGRGGLGKILKERDKNLIVWGVEINEEIAGEAQTNLDRVIVTDIEQKNDVFDNPIHFDSIIFADILEHLKDPWAVLKKFHHHCSPTGRIICSIPNIRHYKVLKDMVRDRWLYREDGILDKDHLRFFSLATIRNMLAIAGYEVEKIQGKKRASPLMKFLNWLSCNKLENFLIQQYLVVGRVRNDKKFPSET